MCVIQVKTCAIHELCARLDLCIVVMVFRPGLFPATIPLFSFGKHRRSDQRLKVPTQVLVDIEVDAYCNENNAEPPTMCKPVSEVGTILGDPAPVSADGLHLPEGCDCRAADEWHDPQAQAEKHPLYLADAVKVGLPGDDKKCRDADSKDGEIGGLNRNLLDPAVKGAS